MRGRREPGRKGSAVRIEFYCSVVGVFREFGVEGQVHRGEVEALLQIFTFLCWIGRVFGSFSR